MKKYILISLLVLAGCTNSGSGGSGTSADQPISDTVVEVSKQSYADMDVVSSPDPVEFLTDATHMDASASFTIKNTSGAPLNLDISVDPADMFKIKVNRCGAQLDIDKSCKLVVIFSNRGLIDGSNYLGSLLINNGVDVPLIGKVVGKPDPAVSGIPHLSISWLGSITASNRAAAVMIKNDGNGNAYDLDIALPEKYIKRLNRCPSALMKGQSCIMQIGYSDRASVPSKENIVISAKSGGAEHFPVSYIMDPTDSRYIIEDISFSDDHKTLTLLGQHFDNPSFTGVTTYSWDEATQTMIGSGTLQVSEKTASRAVLKPNSDISLSSHKFKIEMN